MVNEMEQEVSQEYKENDTEMVSINSVCMNKNLMMLTAKLDMYTGNNNMIILYKIDIGNDGNIMPWYIFKKLLPKVTESELTKTIKKYIKLKTYNKKFITQLGTCVVIVKYKNNEKKYEFFVVPRNGHALLGMPDTAAVNIINVNIDSIEAESTQKENCSTNISGTKTSSVKQETHGAKESCTNTVEHLKNTSNVNGLDSNIHTNTLTDYFLSSPNIEIDKRDSTELTQKLTKCLIMCLMALGALKAHFHYSSNLIASPIKHHQDM